MIELISFLLQEIPASKGHFSKLRQALFTLLFTFLPPFEASSTSECLILLFSPFLIAFGRRKLTFCVDETFNSMKNAFVPFFLVTFRRKSSFFGRSIGSKNGRVNSLPGLPDRSTDKKWLIRYQLTVRSRRLRPLLIANFFPHTSLLFLRSPTGSVARIRAPNVSYHLMTRRDGRER